MKYDMFISYRRTDRELVAQVVRKLEANGVGVWYDAEIEGGADWRESIVTSLEASDMLVIFFSEECNSSRQLKKELAIADDLGKPVVPILIENTKPKGAYLYELADRNWIQAFPDPVSKIDQIVRHLTQLAEKSDGGLDGAVPVPQPAPIAPQPVAPEPVAPVTSETVATADDAPTTQAAPGWRDPPPAPQPKPAPRQREAARPGPKLSDYMPKTTAKQKKAAEARDILPFKWVDALYIIPLLLVFFLWAYEGGLWDPGYATTEDNVGVLMLLVAVLAFYGAIAFPIRYYLRRRPPSEAFRSYVTSSAILYGIFMAGFVVAKGAGMFPNDDILMIAFAFGFIWVCFAFVAFIIYAAMSAQRAIRSFSKNVVKI
jgi:hypothetical protein